MRDLLVMIIAALGGVMVVSLPGAVLLRVLRHRSIVLHILLLAAIAVLSVLAGVVSIAQGMFIEQHDVEVLMIVVTISGLVSLTVAWWLGRRLAAEATWRHEARERERAAEASRRELVAWVSHDLRTPLAGMRAMAEALEDGVVSDPDTVADYTRRMRQETDLMTRLVDDLFELSRIHAGALSLRPARVSLGDAVSDAVAAAGPIARAGRVTLRAEEAGWPTVRASEPELGRVIANLLLNAIQHTPADGTVTVTGGQDAAHAWFAVADGCGGIAPADLPRVFDVGFRGEQARTPHLTGAAGAGPSSAGPAGGGLGLAIVRGLVEAHGGHVEVANAGAGCRFVVSLPAT